MTGEIALPGTSNDRARWYAAYTIPRHEKAVARYLASRDVENFLAVYESARNWNGRRVKVQLPLFPGYVFVRMHAADRMRVLEAPGVLCIVGSRGQLANLADEEVDAIRQVMLNRKSYPHPFLTSGKRVRIASGPLRGLEGVVRKQTRQLRMVVTVESIMRSFEVELEAADLELSVVQPGVAATR